MKFKIEVYVECDVTKQEDCEEYHKPSKDEICETIRTAIEDGIQNLEDADCGEGYKIENVSFDVIEKEPPTKGTHERTS